jgi:hypothetical protein
MVSVEELTTEWSDEDLVNYLHSHRPDQQHFYATRNQIILIIAKIMDKNGMLDPDDSQAINTPGFDQIFIVENGNYSKALQHLMVDVGLRIAV